MGNKKLFLIFLLIFLIDSINPLENSNIKNIIEEELRYINFPNNLEKEQFQTDLSNNILDLIKSDNFETTNFKKSLFLLGKSFKIITSSFSINEKLVSDWITTKNTTFEHFNTYSNSIISKTNILTQQLEKYIPNSNLEQGDSLVVPPIRLIEWIALKDLKEDFKKVTSSALISTIIYQTMNF